MTFDRLSYVDTLTEAGIQEPHARAHAQALRVAMQDTVATKADLGEMSGAVGLQFAAVERRIEALDNKIQLQIAALDRKIDVSARDLVIKGAGGVALLASLMIGLKLLG